MDAYRLPKESPTDKKKRDEAIQQATKYAILTPFKVMEVAYQSMEAIKVMAEIGNPNSVTDAGVGALCARTAVLGAFLNVKINCGDYKDKAFVEDILQKGQQMVNDTSLLEKEILDIKAKFDRQILTEGERYNKVSDVWTHATNEVAKEMLEE